MTRRLWRRSGEPAAWWPWGILPVAGLAILFLFGAAVVAPDIQAEVRSNVGDQLSRAGVTVGSVNADGQIVTARVVGSNFDGATLVALGEATRCDTWVGSLRCPSQVDIEQHTPEATPAVADLRPLQAEIVQDESRNSDHATTAQIGAATGGTASTLEAQHVPAETASRQRCDERFAGLLERASVRFQTNSAEIDATSESLLAELADVAESCPGRMTIAGHTDSRGDAALNEALSLARAEAVRDAFARFGVDMERMQAVGIGSAQPVADNSTPEGRAQNRRIAISMDPTE